MGTPFFKEFNFKFPAQVDSILPTVRERTTAIATNSLWIDKLFEGYSLVGVWAIVPESRAGWSRGASTGRLAAFWTRNRKRNQEPKLISASLHRSFWVSNIFVYLGRFLHAMKIQMPTDFSSYTYFGSELPSYNLTSDFYSRNICTLFLRNRFNCSE